MRRRSPRMRGRSCCGSGRCCWPCSALVAALFAVHHAPLPVVADGQRRRRNAGRRRISSTVPHLGLPLALSVLTIALGVVVYLVLDRARAGGCGVLDGDRLGAGPRLRPGDARPAARLPSRQPRRPERPARHLHDRDLRRRRAGPAGADGAVRRMARTAGTCRLCCSTNGRCSPSPSIGLARCVRAQPADGDRLARHPGLRGGAALHAARRAGPLLHPVHGRDAVGGDPGAGDDAAAGSRRRITAAARPRLVDGVDRRRLRARLSACCCSR